MCKVKKKYNYNYSPYKDKPREVFKSNCREKEVPKCPSLVEIISSMVNQIEDIKQEKLMHNRTNKVPPEERRAYKDRKKLW
tara:strand:+ start:165 stop:407 length:243 start_codon:yes stop_codon:yes gene_type:complete